MLVIVGLLVGALLLVLLLLYKCAYAPYKFLSRYGIKGPTPTPFLGNYKERVSMNCLDFDQIQFEKYGPIMGYYIGRQGYVQISDLDVLKQIMVKHFDNFTDHGPFPNILSDTSEPKDLIFSKGGTWRSMRRTISPSFSASKLKMMLPLIKRSTDNLLAVMKDKAASDKSFDVNTVYSNFTLEGILATAFGRWVDIQKGESDEFSKAMDMLFGGFSDGLIEQFLVFNSHFPWITKSKLMKLLFSYTEAGKALEYIKKVTLDLIKARRESKHTEKYKDILQLMIDATGEEEEGEDENETAGAPTECPAHQQATKPKKGILTDQEVFSNSLGFLLAGNDTTAITLSFISYALAVNPEIQEKLQSEIDAYFDDKPEANLYTAAQEITYLDQVVQEILRLYPSATEIDRYCEKTIVINGVTIPKGSVISVPIALIHRSPQYWKDPDVFNPERFTAEEKANRPQMAHMPFGFGPRSCIGMRLALLEIKIALIEVLQKYSFERAPETEVPVKLVQGITLRPKNAIYLKVVSRL